MLMNSLGFAADLIRSIISQLQIDLPADLSTGNCPEIFTHATGFKNKLYFWLRKMASLKSEHIWTVLIFVSTTNTLEYEFPNK